MDAVRFQSNATTMEEMRTVDGWMDGMRTVDGWMDGMRTVNGWTRRPDVAAWKSTETPRLHYISPRLRP